MTSLLCRGALAAALSLLLAGCGDADKTTAAKAPDPIPVTTIKTSTAESVFTTAGSVVADTRTTIASRFSAYVKALHFKEGDAVHAGDVVVELDNRDVEAAIAAAQGKVSAARAAARDAADDAAKYGALYKEGLISNNQWRKVSLKNEGAKSDLAQAEAMLAVAKTQADYLAIRAEKDGHVAAVMKHEGDLALPGLPIAVIDTDAQPKFEFHVPEGVRSRLAAGQPVTIALDNAVNLSGKIERLNESADRLTRSYLARAEINENQGVRPGMYGKLTVNLGASSRPAVPQTALAERGGLTGVFVVEGEKALFHWVKLGKHDKNTVEVLAGLAGGETLVASPSALLYDGAPVTVKEAK